VLVKQIRETNDLLKFEMDELVRTLEMDQPDFTGEYFAARRIRRTGIRHEAPLDTAELLKNIESIELEPNATAVATANAPASNGVQA
jgi:hypothetical protein